MKPNVVVVTVTYGKRWRLLNKVLTKLMKNSLICEIIVVDNASDYNIKNKISHQKKIKVIPLKSNTGSANGFKSGILEALKNKDCQYIWLLDDDNMPEDFALNELLNHYEKIQFNNPNDVFALLSLRNDRKEFILSSKYGESKRFFPLVNSFLGFHFKNIIGKVIRKVTKRRCIEKNIKSLKIVQVPLAPYGGLFFSKNIIEIIGLPDDKFYLYSDDYEFSYRITKNNGKIYTIPTSKINDIEKSWFNVKARGFLISLITSKSDMRIYYSVRNRIYFENKDLVNNRFIYKINKLFFIVILNALTLLYNKKERKQLILKAIKDGEEKNLGYNKSLKM
ncbi:glycosyltransferase [Heyndrickxia faecalis]|uniref:glycosyltransferase n=1 Tax=Heyndrickxia faecalis TaxID=2824910 RepID=UPI0018196E81|nr:glycosyltransferase [Bacillus sp. (in: firmicutes)]